MIDAIVGSLFAKEPEQQAMRALCPQTPKRGNLSPIGLPIGKVHDKSW